MTKCRGSTPRIPRQGEAHGKDDRAENGDAPGWDRLPRLVEGVLFGVEHLVRDAEVHQLDKGPGDTASEVEWDGVAALQSMTAESGVRHQYATV